MLTIKEKGLLIYIIEHCERVENKTKDITKEIFKNNKDLQEIVCFNILQIGELAKRFESPFLRKYNGVPWKDIKGMRDKVAHGYGTIDFNDVWNTVSCDIIPLKEYCKSIIEDYE